MDFGGVCLPVNWTVAGIEETLFPFENGQTLRQGWSPQCERFPAPTDNDWGVLKTTAIQDGEFQAEHNKQLPAALDPDPLLEVEAGDLLLTCAGPRVRCGVICLVRKTRKRLMISGKMYRFRTDPRVALPDYLESFLRSHDTKKRIDQMKTGISDSGLNLTLARFKTLQVPLPPLSEQRRIVAKIEELFSELDKGIENLKQARAQLAVYRQALLKHAFEGKLTADWRTNNQVTMDWKEVRLDNVAIFTNGFAFKSDEYADQGVPVVRISDISQLGVSLSDCVKIPANEDYSPFELTDGDILIAMSGATTGKFGRLKSDQRCYLNQRVGRLRTRNPELLSQEFLFLHLEGLKRRIQKDAYGGAQPNISGKQISAYLVQLPLISEQCEIVQTLEKQFAVIDTLESDIDANLQKAEALRQSILKKAFAGELVPQDPADEPAAALLARIRAEREAKTKDTKPVRASKRTVSISP